MDTIGGGGGSGQVNKVFCNIYALLEALLAFIDTNKAKVLCRSTAFLVDSCIKVKSGHVGDIWVLVTFCFKWHFSFVEISWKVIFQFWWHLSFGDVLVMVAISLAYLSFVDISVSVTFQLWWHISFGDIWVLMTFQF